MGEIGSGEGDDRRGELEVDRNGDTSGGGEKLVVQRSSISHSSSSPKCQSTSELLPLVQSAEAVGIGAAGELSPD
jgi:hypothetical protein